MSIEAQALEFCHKMGHTNSADVKLVAAAIKEERERCAHIALAIDSKRGNEKEIARAIRAQSE